MRKASEISKHLAQPTQLLVRAVRRCPKWHRRRGKQTHENKKVKNEATARTCEEIETHRKPISRQPTNPIGSDVKMRRENSANSTDSARVSKRSYLPSPDRRRILSNWLLR